MMYIKLFLVVILIEYSSCWIYNPYCLIKECKEENSETDTPKSKPTILSRLNPYCLIYKCSDSETKEVNKDSDSWDPSCWYKDCPNNPGVYELPKFWTRNYWDNEEDIRTWNEKFACIFKKCPGVVKEPEVETEKKSYIRGVFNSVKSYLNAAKPQDIIINDIFTSELNPYCWITECCNEDTLPGNIEKLSDLIHKRVYGQHLVSTLVDAIGSHWNNKHPPRKALVLSFHGPVGTGKNYVSAMIADSLFKLGVKSKYVHHFSGRLHFTIEGNSDSYKEYLYGWLKGNVSACSKQLFIFDEADHMPDKVLNSILPMLDYREKVDGADYRNAIFIFLSNAGSELILEKLDSLYQNNKTREEVEVSDFEREIVMGIFNQQGGFYHSDTISHNLIDHYIPFLPMEHQHILECVMDQFKARHVDQPSEEHILEILNTISWGEATKLKYAKSGCKTVGSKVSFICEKYYKTVSETKEKSDL